jgi:hypothetical protein
MNMVHPESPSEQLIEALDELGDNLNKINDESELVLGEDSEVKNLTDDPDVKQSVVPESNWLDKLKHSLGIQSD